jgi:outer membrane protein insertion porin family
MFTPQSSPSRNRNRHCRGWPIALALLPLWAGCHSMNGRQDGKALGAPERLFPQPAAWLNQAKATTAVPTGSAPVASMTQSIQVAGATPSPGLPVRAEAPQASPLTPVAVLPEEPSAANTVRSQSPDGGTGGVVTAGGTWQEGGKGSPEGQVQPASYQYPELGAQQPGVPGPGPLSTFRTGSPNELFPGVQSTAPSGVATFPQNYADLDIYVTESQTGRINVGGAYNSDNGLMGQFVIDERNFDITRFPRSFRDIVDGTAWRGAGQAFRLELMPGREVQRYSVSWTEPYFLDTPVSLSVSGYLFDRSYFDWDEQRLGGRVGLGYRLTPDLSLSAGLRMENVELTDPRVNTSPELNAALGNSDLFLATFSIVNDTRDHPFLPTEGSYISLAYTQGFGEYDFPRGDIELRRYGLLYQRPDGSGRHTLSAGTRLGFSGAQTPVFENYFAGGFSTMRGFDFRGASPVENGVRVGGEFQWLNTVEYMFPLTADDMIKGVLFCDYGTIEREIALDWDNFRIAPGFGFRVHMPAAGLGAPLAFDFAFPVQKADTDEEQVFSFYMGLIR